MTTTAPASDETERLATAATLRSLLDTVDTLDRKLDLVLAAINTEAPDDQSLIKALSAVAGAVTAQRNEVARLLKTIEGLPVVLARAFDQMLRTNGGLWS